MISPIEPRARSRARTRRHGGFTLLEMLVVLAILGFALVLVAGFKRPWSVALDLRGTAAELAGGLRLARSQAIAGNRPVAFALDLRTHRYQVGAGPVRRLPGGLSLSLVTIGGETQDRTRGDIRFNPDGSSTGGRIVLVAGRRRVAVGVDWLSGRVRIADVR